MSSEGIDPDTMRGTDVSIQLDSDFIRSSHADLTGPPTSENAITVIGSIDVKMCPASRLSVSHGYLHAAVANTILYSVRKRPQISPYQMSRVERKPRSELGTHNRCTRDDSLQCFLAATDRNDIAR